MTAQGYVLAQARSDAQDRLLSADDPLAGLQRRCGGDLPGTIAIPALLELVRKARHFRLKLARTVLAQDGAEQISAWIEAAPREDDEGCDIVIRSWRTAPLPADEALADRRRNAAIVRELAELHAQLDAGQNLLSLESEAADLQDLARAMRAGVHRPWTDFIGLRGSNHHQPMHWRLLDGAEVQVTGSNRRWRAHLLPQDTPTGELIGFELYLVSDEVLESGGDDRSEERRQGPAPGWGMVGREIAPVLRQPLARIIANAETIRTRLAGPLAEEYSAYAADIATAGQHLLALLDDLADLEVVEAESFSTAPDAIDLADVARRAAGILGMRARERGIRLVLPDATVSVAAVGEFRRVLQVLLNLVGNAIRYSPEGSEVRILLADDADRARVTVADDGAGLDQAQQARIFEKFERLGRSGDGGSGLGLYISRRLARAMGGELMVESAAGEGARFSLELPTSLASREGSSSRFALPRIPGARLPRSDNPSEI